jgi:hypothetical protein
VFVLRTKRLEAKPGRPATRTAAVIYETDLTDDEWVCICDRCVARFFKLCELNLGDDWYREALSGPDS